MKLLGISGQAGAGKDFFYEYIKYHSSLPVFRLAFADGVRQECTEFFQPRDKGLFWDKPYPLPVRHMLQWWGTEYRRAEDPDYWVSAGMAKANKFSTSGIVAFTDVRFANEAGAIQDAGGRVVRVIAPAVTRYQRLGGVEAPNHASEDIDFVPNWTVCNCSDRRPPHSERTALWEWLGVRPEPL